MICQIAAVSCRDDFLSFSVNVTDASIQCTYDHHRVAKHWQNYFENLSFGWNYHTIRCLFSELIPSLLVAIFNAGIIACILCRTAQVRRQQEQFHHRNQLSMSLGSGSSTKLPASSPIHLNDRTQAIQRHNSLRASTSTHTTGSNSVPFGKMSWMNIVLLFHSLLFFFSSSITSLVFFSTSDLVLAHCVSVIILANCSLNFYVYCLSGRQFRRELKRIAKRYIRHLHKAFLRKRYSIDDQRSPMHHAKTNIYQPVGIVKQRPNALTIPSPRVRAYPAAYWSTNRSNWQKWSFFFCSTNIVAPITHVEYDDMHREYRQSPVCSNGKFVIRSVYFWGRSMDVAVRKEGSSTLDTRW